MYRIRHLMRLPHNNGGTEMVGELVTPLT